ncbi:unnamed protein product [Allacma fusca]|uniref:Uncharacterized protein n=1 Tax=Allacma fusca TaxID=39272 RepID=A0A8J2KPT4_9HEXA|nr:unnamed protein product [Allacma fusca]
MENINQLNGRTGLKTHCEQNKQERPPPTTKKIDTDSEQDPDFNEAEFVNLRASLHRRIDEAEAKDRQGRRGKHPCRKIRTFFRRIFETKSSTEDINKNDSFITTSQLAKLVSPSSENQKIDNSSSSDSSKKGLLLLIVNNPPWGSLSLGRWGGGN